jgi:hypothetical protein
MKPSLLVAQHDSNAVRVVPLWRDGQIVDRLSGDPNLPGAPYVIRIVNFDNQIVLPHRHPQDEHIVVLAGTWYLGQGERFDKAALQPLEPGDYGFVAKSHAHFAWSKGMTVIQVHGTGPFRMDFVDSAIVMSDSGAVVHIGNATRPITSSEAASRFRYLPGDTVTAGSTWGVVRQAVASRANGVVQYVIEQPSGLPIVRGEESLRLRSTRGSP